MSRLSNPIPLWLDARGVLLDAGKIYVGEANTDPQTNPLDLFADAALTIPVAQPLRTQGGAVVNGVGNQLQVYLAETDWSIRVLDADDLLITYLASTAATTIEYQPFDSNLSLIAELNTEPFGRSLLTLASAEELRDATDIPDSLPLTGGTVSGTITRAGAGAHLFYGLGGFTSGRVFPTNSAAADPTSQPGDLWLIWNA